MLASITLSSQELVAALHSLIQLYEKQFQVAALRSSESDRLTNLSTSLTPTGWIHVSIDPPEVETSFEAEHPHPVTGPIAPSRQISSRTSATLPNGCGLADSPLSMSTGSSGSDDLLSKKGLGSPRASSLSGRTVHNQIWKCLVMLASDPCPKVAEHAQYIVHNVHDKVTK